MAPAHPPRFLLLAAMQPEAEPFLAAASEVQAPRPGPTQNSQLTSLVLEGTPGQVLVTGVGPVNAAAALSGWLAAGPRDLPLLSVGSAGGLHGDIHVGDVVVGYEFSYADVDARAFGYAFGQVPGMPARYRGAVPPETLSAREVPTGATVGEPAKEPGEGAVTGLLVTSSSFVTADLARVISEYFPDALAVDMESAALAHTCALYGVAAFTSIRGISDLCTPRAGEEFHDGLGLAARRSAEIARAVIASV